MKTRILRLLFPLLLLLPPGVAVAQVALSAGHITDSFENPIPLAKLCFVPTNAAEVAAGFRVGSIQVVPNEVCGTVTAGALASGLHVAPSPSGRYYHIYLKQNYSNTILIDYGMTPITGSAWSLDTYDPATATIPSSTLTVGTVTTLAPGTPAYCNVGGTAPSLVLNCGIPAGAAGTNGAPGVGGVPTMDWSAQTGNTLPVQEYTNTAHPPLAYWDAAFHTCDRGSSSQIIRVQVHGESRDIVDNTLFSGISGITRTFAGRWANRLKAQLQGMCGNHGSGMVPFRYGTGTFSSPSAFNANYYTVTGTFAATDTALGPYQPDASDPMLITATSNGAAITFTTADSFDHLLLYGVNGSGIHPWTLYVDSVSVGTCGSGSGSKAATLCTSSAVTLGAHTASIACPTQPCEAYAMEAAAGTTGASIDNFALGSASAEAFGQFPSTQYAFSDLAPGGPALDIISFVTNEPGHSESTATFQTTLTSMVAHDRALTYPASVLLYSPIQDGIASDAWYPIIKTVALAQNTAFVDLRDRWGTALVPWLFGPDTYHENNLGDGEKYSAVAQSIIDIPPPAAIASAVPTVSCASGFSVQSYGPSGGVCQANTVTSGPIGCGAAFAHHASLALASSSVSGGADLAHFPVLFGFNGATANSITLTNFKSVANGGQIAAVDGTTGAAKDIIFCSASNGGVQYNHELVTGTYAPTTGAAEFYVDVPTLSHTTGATVWVFWGNSSATDTSAKNTVWADSNYASVNHGGGGGTLDLTDSTSNANNLTNNGATAADGLFGNGFGVVASTPTYLVDASPTGIPTGTAPRTIESWAKFTTVGQGVPFGYGTGAGPTFIELYSPGNGWGAYDGAGFFGSAFTLDTGWHFYALTLPASTTTIANTLMYIDGAPGATGICQATCTNTLATPASNIQVNGLPGLPSSSPFTGTVDEVRISSGARAAGWLATEYTLYSDPATAWTVTVY